jgi:hypothetical protein
MSTSKIIYSLHDFIENPEPDKNIQQKKYETPLQSYLLLNSESESESESNSENIDKEEDIYHSIILEYPSKRLLSFAPPKDSVGFSSVVDNNHEIYINELNC